MGTVDRLLKATEDIWASYHEKPFVQGLKYGTLDQKKFRSYIIQDYWYLMDYTKVFAIGVAKSKSVEVMKLFAKYIQAILDGEVNVHNGYMADFGITQEELDLVPTPERLERRALEFQVNIFLEHIPVKDFPCAVVCHRDGSGKV